jgi:LysR family transcriptional regulator, regulator of abg operon
MSNADIPKPARTVGLDLKVGHLRALLAIVEAGSLSAGARRLGLSQPTLSRTIQQFELSLGMPVFSRGPGGLVLTELGRAVLPHAQRLLHAQERSLEAAEQLGGGRSGRVTVAASALPRIVLLPQASRVLWDRFPAVHLSIVDAAYPFVLQQFDDGSLDFAMCPVPASTVPNGFERRDVLEVRLAVTLRAGHPLKEARSLADLTGCQWIAAGPRFGQGLQEAFRANGLEPPHCRLHCESLEYALGLVARTDYLTLAPRTVVTRSALSGALRQLEHSGDMPLQSIAVLIPQGRALTPASQLLLNALMDFAATLHQEQRAW